MRWPVRDHSLLKVCSVLTFSKTSTFKTDMFVRFQYFQNYLFSKLICLFVLTFSKTAIFKTDLFARFWHFPKHHFSKLISPPCPFRVGHVFRKRRPYRFLYEPHTSQMIHCIDWQRLPWGQRDFGSMLKPYCSSTSSAGEDTQTRNSLRVAKVEFLLEIAEKVIWTLQVWLGPYIEHFYATVKGVEVGINQSGRKLSRSKHWRYFVTQPIMSARSSDTDMTISSTMLHGGRAGQCY